MSLYSQAVAVSTPRETKQDVISYFRKEYPGVLSTRAGTRVEEWRSRLATAIQPFVGGKRESILRQFQGARGGGEKVTPKWRQAYEDLGALLPPIPPKGGYQVSGTFWMHFADYPSEPRSPKGGVHISGKDAQRFLENPAQALINVYMGLNVDDEEPNAQPGNLDAWDVRVRAVE